MRHLYLGTCVVATLLLFGVIWAGGGADSSHSVRKLFHGVRPPITPGYGACDRNPRNEALSEFARNAIAKSSVDPLLPQATTFEGFVDELKASIDRHPLPARTINLVFSEFGHIHPACNGDWMEFGVFMGASINRTAHYRAKHCAAECPPVFGFDTFTGLPEAWIADVGLTFNESSFSLQGMLPPVAQNAFLVKGLFSDAIPLLLEHQHQWARASGFKGSPVEDAPLAYLHIDCDLFAGARDALMLLSHKIVPGTVLLFDELINYHHWRDHEAKALWLWLQESGAKLATIGTLGPLPGPHNVLEAVMDPTPKTGYALEHQSVGFLVVSKPGATTAMWH